MRGLTGNRGKSTIPPTPPLEAVSIADYFCITEPCYGLSTPYRPPSKSSGLFGLPTTGSLSQKISEIVTTGKVEPSIAALPPWLVDQDLGDSVYVPEETAGPVAGEAAAINPARPVAHVTAAERDQFYADRASILARYPGYVIGAESDPIFIITDAPASGTVPPPVTNTVAPPLLGVTQAPQPTAPGGLSSPAGSTQSVGRSGEFGEQPMGWLKDFGTSLLGSIDFDPATPGIFGSSTESPLTSIPDLIGGLAGTYLSSGISTPSAAQLPPYINPSTQVSSTNVVPIGTAGRPTVGCISQRDIQIAAAAGTSPEMVDLILKLGRRNRRRRRMLTKSDIGDISTMRSILGNGEAFKLWLAKATR